MRSNDHTYKPARMNSTQFISFFFLCATTKKNKNNNSNCDSSIHCCKFHPNGDIFACGLSDGSIKVYSYIYLNFRFELEGSHLSLFICRPRLDLQEEQRSTSLYADRRRGQARSLARHMHQVLQSERVVQPRPLQYTSRHM